MNRTQKLQALERLIDQELQFLIFEDARCYNDVCRDVVHIQLGFHCRPRAIPRVHSSVDKATVLDASGSEADNSNEALMVPIAPLYYVRRVDV